MDITTVTKRLVSDVQAPPWRPNLQIVHDLSRKEKVVVHIHVRLQQLGEIDTVKETFKATLFMQARWREPRLDSMLRKGRRYELQNWQDFWNPSLVLDNITEEPRQTIWTMVHYNRQGQASIVQTHKIKGSFYENMELRQFPFDTQDLSITILSQLNAHNITLKFDKTEEPINAKGFINSSEWHLHENLTYDVHNPRPVSIITSTEESEVSENPSLKNDREEINASSANNKLIRVKEDVKEADLFPVYEDPRIVGSLRPSGGTSFFDEMSRPSLTVTCKATRRASFFVFNVILIIMLLGALIFCTFAVNVNLPQHRIAISFTLLLVNITFKGALRQSLPKISYLTYLDMYIGFSMLHMGAVSAWHAVVGELVVSDTDTSAAEEADRIALIVLAVIYVTFNVIFIIFNVINVQITKRKFRTKRQTKADTNEALTTSAYRKQQIVPN